MLHTSVKNYWPLNQYVWNRFKGLVHDLDPVLYVLVISILVGIDTWILIEVLS